MRVFLGFALLGLSVVVSVVVMWKLFDEDQPFRGL